MGLVPKFANNCVSAEADALSDLLDNGYLRIYSGTKPANADAAITGTLLAELRFANPASGASVNGLITFTNPASVTASQTGTATHFRAWKSDGTTPVYDGEVGTSGSDMNLNSVAIQSGATVSITSLTLQVSKG